MRHRHFLCRRKRFKISLEVAVPFTVALNSDATILPHATADELIVEVINVVCYSSSLDCSG
jgi:hypothetical protein